MRFISDDEMILMIRLKSEEAIRLMYEKYESFIRTWALKSMNTQRARQVELCDMMQIGKSEFWQVLQKYRDEEGNFYSFFKLCLEREFYLYIRTFLDNSVPNYTDFSLDAPVSEDNQSTFLDIYESATSSLQPDKQYELREEIEQIYTAGLTALEVEIIHLKMLGFSYREIAQKLAISRKQVDNHLARIKIKIRNNR